MLIIFSKKLLRVKNSSNKIRSTCQIYKVVPIKLRIVGFLQKNKIIISLEDITQNSLKTKNNLKKSGRTKTQNVVTANCIKKKKKGKESHIMWKATQ